MPTINFNQTLRNLAGNADLMREEQTTPDGAVVKSQVPATLGYIAVTALVSPILKEERREDGKVPADGPVKMRRWQLAQKIQMAVDPLRLTAEEVVELKEVIGNSTFTVTAAGQALVMIDAE